jgi:outer membrane protein assembly factor BamD (BamD/ComL family)
MRIRSLSLLPAVILALLLSACASGPGSVPSGLTPAQYFQRAQDAADRGELAVALSYYTGFRDAYPGETERGTWAQYEIAFLTHKMGDNAKAMALLNDFLALYEKDPSLPEAPRILAQKLKARLAAKAAHIAS